ncbi:MAG: hypothetical protein HYZ52_00675 [Candidatus Omnitrophica bacterium]|nr:hypothetical protein [Candidatus Omnitrophota bacterium]
MTTMLKMNRNRQVNIPSAFVARLSLGEDRYFKADLKGNHIILTPVDPVERVFSKESLDLVEEVYGREKKSAKRVTPAWIQKAHRPA